MDLPEQLTDHCPTQEQREAAKAINKRYQSVFKNGKLIYILKKKCNCS